jgi:hypothetical protein
MGGEAPSLHMNTAKIVTRAYDRNRAALSREFACYRAPYALTTAQHQRDFSGYS